MSTETGIKRVAVVGTGVIGASWAAYFLAQGLKVSATDPAPGARERLTEAVLRHWPTLVESGLATGASVDNLSFHDTLEAALEGAPVRCRKRSERADLKLALFERMDTVLDQNVVIASSSSGLLMSDVQAACRHPERVVLGHPFNPPHLIPLVEVIGGKRTSAETIQRTLDFYRAIGKRPINPKKEVKGHIANRLQAALWRESVPSGGHRRRERERHRRCHRLRSRLALGCHGAVCKPAFVGRRGGMRHLLDHLGGPIESWWGDLGTPVLTPELKQKVVDGIDAELANRSDTQITTERDELILAMLRAKAAAASIP